MSLEVLRDAAGDGGVQPTFNVHGFIYADIQNNAYAQVFRNGVVEAVSSTVMSSSRMLDTAHVERLRIGADYLEPKVRQSLMGYLDGLAHLDVPLPFVVALSLLNVTKGLVDFDSKGAHFRIPRPIGESRVDLPPIIVEEAINATRWRRTLRPIFDALANASGLTRAGKWDANGDCLEAGEDRTYTREGRECSHFTVYRDVT